METTQIRSDDNDIFNKPRLSSGLNVLTILTFIGCGWQLISSLISFIFAKSNYDKKDEFISKMTSGDMPSFAKKMMPDPVLYDKLISQTYHNRVQILIVSLVATALCFYGALQMRK